MYDDDVQEAEGKNNKYVMKNLIIEENIDIQQVKSPRLDSTHLGIWDDRRIFSYEKY